MIFFCRFSNTESTIYLSWTLPVVPSDCTVMKTRHSIFVFSVDYSRYSVDVCSSVSIDQVFNLQIIAEKKKSAQWKNGLIMIMIVSTTASKLSSAALVMERILLVSPPPHSSSGMSWGLFSLGDITALILRFLVSLGITTRPYLHW